METVFISSITELRQTVSSVLLMLRGMECITDDREYDIHLCLRELLSNSFNYSGSSTIRLLYGFNDDHFRFSVVDKGTGFNVHKMPCCPDVMSEHGRGIFLVHQLADYVRYNKKGTAVTVKFFY